jgi:hypothetical protein
MRIAWIGVMAAAVAAGPVWAHDGHEDGTPVGAVSPESWWLDLVPRAAASQRIEVDERRGVRFIRADGLPDHATGRFPNRGNPNSIAVQSYYFRVPLRPAKTGRSFFYRPNQLFGVAINGVVFDPNTAEFWNDDRRSGWMIEALSGTRPLGIDQNNAHVQPNGAYHYHGVPTGLVDRLRKGDEAVMIGWAADGFPIYVQAGLHPGWRLKDVRDAGGPGGRPDGTYARDFVYVRGLGDLDECNGRERPTAEFPEGTYYYVVTEAFPHVPRCFSGTPDGSFVKHGGPGPGGRPPPHGRPPPR